MLRVLYLILIAAIGSLLQGCASGGGETLKIEGKRVAGWEYMPAELTEMLRQLGYNWIPIRDPNSHHEAKAVEQNGNFMMKFEYAETGQVRIDLLINWEDGVTRLHFYQPGSQTLSDSSRGLLEKLQNRVKLEFGESNVSY